MNRFKDLRKYKGLSQKSLAESLGISQSVICDYENNKVIPTATVTCLYADFFGVSTDYILGREDDFGTIISPTGNGAELSKDEKELLRLYNKLGPFEREAMIIQMQALAEKDTIKK